jgi:isoamylase
VQFTLPECTGGTHWTLVLDTNAPDSNPGSSFASGTGYGITARSLVLFALVA